MGLGQHGGIVVRVPRGHHPEVQPLEGLHRGPLLVGLPEVVGGDEAGGVGGEPWQKRVGTRARHERHAELVEGVGEDHHLVLPPQGVEELPGSRLPPHPRDDLLDVRQPQAVQPEEREPTGHELVVVGLVAGGAPQLGDAGAFQTRSRSPGRGRLRGRGRRSARGSPSRWRRQVPARGRGMSPVEIPDPGDEEGPGDGQQHRPHEEPHDAEGQDAPEHPGQDEQERQVGALLDEDRANHVVHRDGHEREHQHHRSAAGGPRRVEPDRRRRDTSDGPSSAMQRTTRRPSGALRQGRRRARAPRPRAGSVRAPPPRCRGPPHGRPSRRARRELSPRSPASRRRRAGPTSRALARCVQDSRDDHREHELDDGASHPAGLLGVPAPDDLQVGLDPGEERFGIAREALPPLDEPLPHDGHAREPGGRGAARPSRASE